MAPLVNTVWAKLAPGLRVTWARLTLIESAVSSGSGYRQAFAEAAKSGPAVAKFFDDVMVMADDARLRDARLRLLRRLEGLILQLADVSEIVPEEK